MVGYQGSLLKRKSVASCVGVGLMVISHASKTEPLFDVEVSRRRPREQRPEKAGLDLNTDWILVIYFLSDYVSCDATNELRAHDEWSFSWRGRS
jgi:hypothetical protein